MTIMKRFWRQNRAPIVKWLFFGVFLVVFYAMSSRRMRDVSSRNKAHIMQAFEPSGDIGIGVPDIQDKNSILRLNEEWQHINNSNKRKSGDIDEDDGEDLAINQQVHDQTRFQLTDEQQAKLLSCLRRYYPTEVLTRELTRQEKTEFGEVPAANLQFPHYCWRDLPADPDVLRPLIRNVGSLDEAVSLTDPDFLHTAAEVPFIPGRKNPCYWVELSGKKRLHCLPYVILVGTEKSGSTDLYYKLLHHQHVFSGNRKEMHWFNALNDHHGYLIHNNTLGGFGEAFNLSGLPGHGDSEFYYGLDLLSKCANNTCPYILTDFTPRYFHDGYQWQRRWYHLGQSEPRILVPHKIRLLLPNTKLIIMFRNPTDRIYSSYNYYQFIFHPNDRDKVTPENFHVMVQEQIANWNNCLRIKASIRQCMYGFPYGLNPPANNLWEPGSFDQIRIGLYALYMKEWLSQFSLEQFLVIIFEDYVKNADKYIQDVLHFLKLDPFSEEAFAKANEHKAENAKFTKRGMLPETRQLLDDFYRESNVELSRLLKLNEPLWTEMPSN